MAQDNGTDDMSALREEIRSLRELIIRMDERMKSVQDHETRIRSLEKARWPLPSLAVVLAAVAIVVPFLVHGA